VLRHIYIYIYICVIRRLKVKLCKNRMTLPDYGGRSPKRVAGKIICTYVTCFVRASSFICNKK